MDMNEYQQRASQTAIFPDVGGLNYVYPAIGLAGETGEIMEIVKKVIRDQGGELDFETRKKLSYELGDNLWYLSQLADAIGFSLDTIATRNLEKLASRKERGKLQGSGDER